MGDNYEVISKHIIGFTVYYTSQQLKIISAQL